ncbi:putative sensor with HAMP domain-containing protein [Thermincola ferriacetica]|uniref:histidine kinase n=1 Tax=Thermincola ferriacetica TaxID=281456 RepID=A0A0L6VZK5_9FIRM|nr:cache domain-containing protein [Thermincola ferriacetica]KNZ68700.1 putative sensor with HAMP domain-containing protein [Thermincola ferriacetica]
MMRSLKQQLLFLVIGPLILLSIIGTVITVAYMKDRAILATDTKARCDLATAEEILNLMYPGYWEERNGILYKGDTKITNNFAVVDRIAELTGDTVTIFLGDIRTTTTVREKNGQRAIGTRVSSIVSTKVLKNGELYLGEANVVGQMYRTAYKPIRDANGKIIGMLYVGISKKLSDELLHKSLFTIVGITVILTVLVALIAWYFTQRVIIGPLQEITKSTKELATGQLNQKVEIASKNEIGELAAAFNQMVEGMQSFAMHIARVAGTEVNTVTFPVHQSSSEPNLVQVKPVVEINLPASAKNDPIGLDTGYPLPVELPKGLNEATLKQILAFIESENRPMSAEEIGEGVNLTRVTARRYLEFLEQIGKVEVEQKYGTVGRPVKLYKSK